MPRIVDLSMPIAQHFRWPVDRQVKGDFAAGDVFQVTRIGLSVHAFTHMDSQRHILADGFTTDDIALERVVGDCAVVDLTAVAANEGITAERLEAAGGHVRPDDIVLLKTAWDRRRSYTTPDYWTDAPFMTREASEWLLARRPRAVAYDFPQDETIRLSLQGIVRPLEENVTHDVLLRNGVVMIEYLCNAGALSGSRTFLCALPLKLPGADGAPARVIALEQD
ncbi:MAG: cyclase family protein [Rhodospirillaceae bacterium]|nr:cyclase family protein [Rhodospirillaceae bacterium]